MSRNDHTFLAICFFCIPLILLIRLDQRQVRAASPAQRPVSVSPLKDMVKVGVIIDENSTVGMLAARYIDVALSDFYDEHDGYRTRVDLCYRNTEKGVLDAASAALDLMENERVDAILGPGWSSQARFIIELGAKARVPIISFSATCPFLSPARNQFFVRTAYDDASQVKAIQAVVQAFGWREVVLIYEDTVCGNGLIPYITDAFQAIDTRVPYRSVIHPSAEEIDILTELVEVMNMPTRVFLVHMTASLRSRLFLQAKKSRMLNDETVWIVTDGLTTLLDPIGRRVAESMQGVIGVRPHLHQSKRLERLQKKLPIGRSRDINLFGLWAYDTVWALGDAVENARRPLPHTTVMTTTSCRTKGGVMSLNNFSSTRISDVGPEILQWLLPPVASPMFEVFNVVNRTERVIGYWTRKHGLSIKVHVPLAPFAKKVMESPNKVPSRFNKPKGGYSTSINDLQPPIWPGGSRRQPKGWVIPAVKGSKMRIGVPVKSGFTQFFKIEWDTRTGEPSYSGFSYDVFLEVLKRLPFAIEYEFKPFMNASRQSTGSYDDMINQINSGEVDAVVGDTTIVAKRSNSVDFTLPYSQTGVSMLVVIKDDERRNMWIFLKSLKWDLWLTTGLAFVFTGFAIWVLERRKNDDFNGSRSEQLGLSLWFSFSTLVFAHREKIISNWTRMVLVIWVFVVLIITQSYTASLASFLTVQRLQPKFVDALDLVKDKQYVGYQRGSFVKDLLIQQMNFSESMLIPYGSAEEYHDALSKGSGNGGVAAIFDEIPFIQLFLAKYCSQYTMVGPTYKTDGLGFVFPMRSPLVSYISRAVLNLTEDKAAMDPIERKYSLSQTPSCQDQRTPTSDLSLSVKSFGGLFIITGFASLSAIMAELLLCKWHHLHLPTWARGGRHPARPFPPIGSNFSGNGLPSTWTLQRSKSKIIPLNSP
ncbi:hypothetical protein SAY86_018659 [Trapa natans]|uniref:Glutamate receptor n=1 Tax=Trapa natans TaxID=22666 RepID=A0AAN7R1Y1_TRANT|nr:hypothetical protein SAY86_018659 [Trapa natans]